MLFRYIVNHQVYIIEKRCAKVFHFALMFTVHYLERLTTCETFTNLNLTTLMYPQCGKIIITATNGIFTHVMQLGNVGKYIAEITHTRECGPFDELVIFLANTKYDLDLFTGYRMTFYQVKLQYLSDLYGMFELRNVAVLFNFLISSTQCSVDIYYRKVVRRVPTARIRAPTRDTVSEIIAMEIVIIDM